jgi:plasmid replication initiation protein
MVRETTTQPLPKMMVRQTTPGGSKRPWRGRKSGLVRKMFVVTETFGGRSLDAPLPSVYLPARETIMALEPQQLSLSLPLDSPLTGKIKNDRTVMVFNFFSLTRERVTELPVYNDGTVRIDVRSTSEGVATIWDKELLIYAASLLHEKRNRGEGVCRKLTFTANDFFRVCRIHPGGTAYDRLEGALKRLKATTITTNIETGGEGTEGGFSWITEYKVNYRRNRDGEKALKSITIELCEWLYRALERHTTILTYDPGYFDLTPLEKRLYEIARAHCGDQPSFKINIEKLRLRVGSDTDLKKFKLALTKIAARRKPLPDYGLSVVDPRRAKLLDPRQPQLPGRTPLRSYMVFFYRHDHIARATYENAPELPDHDL